MGWMDDFVDCGTECKTEPILSISLIFNETGKVCSDAIHSGTSCFQLCDTIIPWKHSLRATDVNNCAVSVVLILLHTWDMNIQNIQFLFL
jgi:hypothetical protein